MTRSVHSLVLVLPAAIGVLAAIGVIGAGVGVIEALAVGAVVMAVASVVRRSLSAPTAAGSDR